jgi:SulP family sulfate permease
MPSNGSGTFFADFRLRNRFKGQIVRRFGGCRQTAILGIVEAMHIKRLTLHEVLADLSLAMLSSVVTVLGTVAFAGMIFSGPLARVLPLAFVTFLAGTAVSALLIALLSRFYCNLSGAQDQPAAILATFTSGLTSMSVLDEGTAISTIFAIIILSTAGFGLALLLLGILKLGKYTQLVPYPVIGGFLAGVGVLLFLATIRFLSGITPSLDKFTPLFTWPMILRWLPSLIAACLLHWGMNRIRHVLFLPVSLIGIVIWFYIVAGISSLSLTSLRESGLVFGSLHEAGLFEATKLLAATKIDWSDVFIALGKIGGLILVCTIGASLATTALEIGAETELEPNHELRAHGLANLAAALVGGLPAFTLTGPSLAYLRLGVSSRLMPILRPLFSLVLGVAGLNLLGFVPKVLVGTLLFVFAFRLMDEWLIRSRHRLGRSDYILVVTITGIISLVGFLPGVAAGILIAVLDFQVKYSRLNVIKAELSGRDFRSDVERSPRADRILREVGERVITFEIQGFIFFGTAIGLLQHIRERIEASTQKIEFLILGFINVDGLDAAAHFALRKLKTFTKAQHICLLYAGLNDEDAKDLRAANILDEDLSLCFATTPMAVEWVENHLLKQSGLDDDPVSAEDALVSVIADRDKAMALLPYFTIRDIRGGDTVFRQGDDDYDTIVLVRGTLSAHLDLGDGQSVRLRKFLPGALTGEMAFYTDRKRSASLMADTDATIGVISGASLLRLNQDQPAVAAEFHQMAARLMAQRIISMNSMLRILLPRTSRSAPAK